MEVASRQLLSKFKTAHQLLERAPAAGVGAAGAQALVGELGALELRFALTTSHLYIAAAHGEAARQQAQVEYMRILASENFSGGVDRIVVACEGLLRAAGVPLRDALADEPSEKKTKKAAGKAPAAKARPLAARPPAALCAEIQRLVDTYPRTGAAANSRADGAAQQVDYARCPSCAGEMAVDSARSEMKCLECGALRELPGTVFEDSQFYSQEGQKAKSGTFNPNRHFRFWWTHLLAREPEEELGDKDDPDNQYGEKLLAELRRRVVRNRQILRLLTVNDIRNELGDIDTDFNKNVPLILKKLTGVGPPALSDEIAVRAENLFTKAIEIGERIRRPGRENRNYYPFYIMKILDNIIPHSDGESRRILYYIYIQSEETVGADDDDWKQICLEMPPEEKLKYRPTDRTEFLQYHPQ